MSSCSLLAVAHVLWVLPHPGHELVNGRHTDTLPQAASPSLVIKLPFPGPQNKLQKQASHCGMHIGMMSFMTVQIAIRLRDDIVAFLDKSVAAGKAPSRAALVARAVEREMRRQAAEQDAAILRERGGTDDLDELVAWTVANAMTED